MCILYRKYTKEDNVNSALFYMTIHDVTLSDSQSIVNLTEHGVEMKFVYVDVSMMIHTHILANRIPA